MTNYFAFEEADANRFLLKCNPEIIPMFTAQIHGAPATLASRLLGLSFPQYLRYCRDILEAEVIGRKKLYPVVYFKKTPAATQLVKLLNSRMELLVSEYEKPYTFVRNEDNSISKIDFNGNIIEER